MCKLIYLAYNMLKYISKIKVTITHSQSFFDSPQCLCYLFSFSSSFRSIWHMIMCSFPSFFNFFQVVLLSSCESSITAYQQSSNSVYFKSYIVETSKSRLKLRTLHLLCLELFYEALDYLELAISKQLNFSLAYSD